MSQSRPDNAFRPSRARGRDLSTPQLRALRKELLIVRASVERAEMAESLVELRETVTHFSWLRFLVPGFAGSSGGASAAGLGAGIGGLLKQYPLLSSLASLVLAKPLRESVASAARPVVKWGGLAFTAWEAWRIWQQVRRQRGAPQGGSRRYASEEDDLTG
ncbi:DUF3318 domain-containing protein [Paraburkholderia sp. Ac-20347]|jgi:hypothetical protein|uniref:DUF3318 domain-containing protein n=1 Tax=Paraburkholderia sp. Ac-20347 TaxID=2703892 RepID=UPI00197E6BC3|nr:DUF3318 domain-containing protein [Paraburkholderia sp. Ac-20347]MBN3812597.1 DUF3318 domain-containing protein [Paraburkholderia sp. Ac-20347]